MKKLIQSLKDDLGFRGAVLFLFLMPLVWDLVIMFINHRANGYQLDFHPISIWLMWPLLILVLVVQFFRVNFKGKEFDGFKYFVKVFVFVLALLAVFCALIYLLNEYIG